MKFSQKDYIKELSKELASRERIWKNVPGHRNRFLSQEQQRRYDVMNEILQLFEYLGEAHLKRMQEASDSNKGVVQGSLFHRD